MSRRQPITTAFPRTQSVSLLGILSLAAALVLITPRNASAQAQPPFAESEEVSLAAFGDNGTQSPRHRYSASEEAYLFDRLGRSRRITRAGTYLSTIGFAVYTAGMLGVAASSVDYNYGAGLPVSLTAMGAGFVATWGGSAMWGAGVLNTANALNALDIPVPRGAGIAALACGSVAMSICTWVAAPIQTSMNRRALFNSRYADIDRVRWAVVPTRLGRRAPGLVIAASF